MGCCDSDHDTAVGGVDGAGEHPPDQGDDETERRLAAANVANGHGVMPCNRGAVRGSAAERRLGFGDWHVRHSLVGKWPGVHSVEGVVTADGEQNVWGEFAARGDL